MYSAIQLTTFIELYGTQIKKTRDKKEKRREIQKTADLAAKLEAN
jgi:hypothetical protein